MTLENLEAEVLSLPRASQATLLARLLEHLGQSNEIDKKSHLSGLRKLKYAIRQWIIVKLMEFLLNKCFREFVRL
ncbi:MAG: hypothetical protein VKL41_03215 [Snowella sp.]|nr:hypothetical protein [Snowella sp.]